MKEEMIKAYKSLEARKGSMIADKNTNISAGVLSVNSDSFKPFDKVGYLADPKKSKTQREWANGLQDGDGFVTVSITDSKKSTPVSMLLSTLKGVEGLQIDEVNQSIVPEPDTQHEMIKGVLLVA